MLRSFSAVMLSVSIGLSAMPVHASSAPPPILAMSEAVTGQVIAELESGLSTCSRLDAAYQFDCYRQAYRAAGSAIKGRPDYKDASKALKAVEDTLRAIVRKNGDRGQPNIRVGGKTYKAIKPAAVPAAAQAFRASRQEAATLLLRSTDKAALHYTRIADALNSNKVLIRT